jgi:hypothetical protein
MAFIYKYLFTMVPPHFKICSINIQLQVPEILVCPDHHIEYLGLCSANFALVKRLRATRFAVRAVFTVGVTKILITVGVVFAAYLTLCLELSQLFHTDPHLQSCV